MVADFIPAGDPSIFGVSRMHGKSTVDSLAAVYKTMYPLDRHFTGYKWAIFMLQWPAIAIYALIGRE